MAQHPILLGQYPGDKKGDPARVAGGKINQDFAELFAAVGNLSGLTLVAGPVTKLAPGASPTASLTGTAPNYTLNLGLPEGAAGAGAPNSADILAIAEKDRLERALVAAGVPDEPSLILDFIRGVHFASKSAITASIVTLVTALGGASSFSRASTATYWGSDGLLKTAANNVPRLDFAPVTRLPRGLRLETAARTNMLTYSQQFDDAAWAKSGLSVIADAAVAIDGTTTMDKLVESATNAQHILGQNVTSVVGGVYEGGVFVRAGERDHVLLQLDDGVAPFAQAIFDLTTGTATASAGTFTIEPVGGAIYKVAVAGIATGSITRFAAGPYNGAASYMGDGSSGLFAWGAHLGNGPILGYIPTGASTVTQAAESLVFDGGGWLFANEMTVLVEYTPLAIAASGADRVVSFDDTSPNNSVILRQGAAVGGADLLVQSAGVAVIDSDGGAVAIGGTGRFGLSYGPAGWAFVRNGVVINSLGAVAPPAALNRLVIGVGAFAGHIRKIIVYPKRLSDAKLQALTNLSWS